MIGNKMTNPKKSTKSCGLEVIAEENEIETGTKNTLRVEPKRESISKTTENKFTPFLSSWGSRSVQTKKSFTSTDIASKGPYRQQYESLKSDYKELFEYTRREETYKQAIIGRVEELENECLKLRCQSEENSQKLKLERKNAEQMKSDYEFMLETQKQTFKMREKELLEQFDKSAVRIETDMQTSMKTDIQLLSAINTFEFEEISEKLESFERQNKYLQSCKDHLELQNKLLKDSLAEMKESYSSLELQHNELKIRNNLNQPTISIVNDSKTKLTETEGIPSELNLELNRNIDELCLTREKLIGTTEGFDIGRMKCFHLEKQQMDEKKSSAQKELRFASKSIPDGINSSEDSTTRRQYLSVNNEIVKILHNLQNVIQLKPKTKDLSKCCSRLGLPKQETKSNETEDSPDLRKYKIQEVKIENSNEYEDGSSDNDILNLIQICLAQVNVMYRIEKRNTENANILIIGNDSMDDLNEIIPEPENGINSVKPLGTNKINMSDAEKINKTKLFVESPDRSVVEDSDLLIQSLKLRHENDRRNYSELQEAYENTRNVLAKKNIEIQVLLEENVKLLENIETPKKEKHSQRIEYEKLSNSLLERDEIKQRKKSEQKQIETEKENSCGRISNMKSQIDKQNDQLQKLCNLSTDSTEQELQKAEKENQSKPIITIEHNAISGSQINILYENDDHIKNIEFDRNIFTLKEKLIELKYENENLKGAISKINKHVQDIKIIFINYKQINVKEAHQQLQTLKSDILKAKNGFEEAIKLLNKEIQGKNQLIDELQKKIFETSNNLKFTKEWNVFMKDDNFKTGERAFKKRKNDNSLTSRIDNSISDILSEHIHKVLIGIKAKEEEQPCDLQQTELENIKNIGNWLTALIQERNMLKCNCIKLIMKGNQLDRTDCEEKNKVIQDKRSQNNYIDGSEMPSKVIEVQSRNFKIEDESERGNTQICRQERNNELAMTDEYKKEDKWKLLRTREHDSRRNIDLNTLSSETTVRTCKNCEIVNGLNQKLKTEVAKMRFRYETRNINQ